MAGADGDDIGVIGLRRSQVFEAMGDAAFICDLEGFIVDCNPAAEAMFGATREQMLGQQPDQVTGMPSSAPPAAQVLAGLREHGVWTGDIPLPGIDGGVGSSMVFPMHDGAGNVIGFAGINRDVSAERRTSAALAEAEHRWRTVLELAPTGLALTDPDGRFVLVNPALCEMVGYPPERLLEMTFHEITHPDDRNTQDALVGDLLSGRTRRFSMDKRYLHADGHVLWGHVSIAVVRDATTGRPQHFLATVEDVSARRQAGERLAAIIASASDAFIGMSATGTVTEWNQAAEKLFGWPREEAVGRQLAGLIIPPESRAAHARGLHTAVGGGPAPILGKTITVQALTRGDARISVELTVWRADGTPSGDTGEFYAFIRDRTEYEQTNRRQQAIAAAQTAIADIELSPQKVMTEICRHAQALTRAPIATLELQEGEDMVCRAAVTAPAPGAPGEAPAVTWQQLVGLRVPIGQSLSGVVLTSDTPMICDDVETDDRVHRVYGRDLGIRSMVVVPLRRSGTVHGILKLASPEPQRFTDQDVATLTLLAAPFGTALVNALNLEASYRQASTDQVTGLGNRAHALTHLEKALLRLTRRGNSHTAVIFLDLDRFKQVNDTYGHITGDRLLARVAKRINSVVRASDTTARYGGDEFVVVAEDLAFPDDAESLGKRLVSAIAGTYLLPHPANEQADERDREPESEHNLQGPEPVSVDIGVSVGIAVTATYLPLTDLLHAADEAMYDAKRQGGDTYTLRHLDA